MLVVGLYKQLQTLVDIDHKGSSQVQHLNLFPCIQCAATHWKRTKWKKTSWICLHESRQLVNFTSYSVCLHWWPQFLIQNTLFKMMHTKWKIWYSKPLMYLLQNLTTSKQISLTFLKPSHIRWWHSRTATIIHANEIDYGTVKGK